MEEMTNITMVAPPQIGQLTQAIYLRSENLPAKHGFALHSHPWNQLVYATEGSLLVTVAATWYVITPEQAIWLPTGVAHTTSALQGASFRNLYVADQASPAMPAVCTVFAITPLLRALIIELDATTQRQEEDAYIAKLQDLILAQLSRLTVQDCHLPWPQSLMLRTLCDALYANPADPRTLDEWGRLLGASARTLARRFEKEVGMSLRVWRQRLRLFLAMAWLSDGRGITEIALTLGYASTSAFSYMFHQETGQAPSAWRAR